MYCYGIDENGQPAVEFVKTGQSSKTPFLIIGGAAPTEERARLLLRQLVKKREKNAVRNPCRS